MLHACARAALLLGALFTAALARVEDPAGSGRSAGISPSPAAGATSAPVRAAGAPVIETVHDEDADDATAADGVHRALAMLEYVASDYDNAIGDHGVVLDPYEYAEQKQFLAEVAQLLGSAAPRPSRGVRRELESIRKRVLSRQPSREVVPRIRALHVRLVRECNVRLTPQQVPSLATGRILFEQICAACHGADGRAQTERARDLHPRPVDFHALDLERRLSPYLAFGVVTFGVPGTAMAGFPTLTEEERWDLAFFVCALRHQPPARTAYATVAQAAGTAPVPLTLEDLTRSTDATLRALLGGLSPGEQASQLARWRWVPPLDTGR